MRIGKYHGETMSCCLCGCMDYDELIVQELGIATGMVGYNYSFCKKCWLGKNLGRRLLQFLEYPKGMYVKDEYVELIEMDEEA